MKTSYSLLLLLVCFVFYGCTSLDHVEPMKGNIEGYVRLRNYQQENSGAGFTLDHSGVNIRLEGIEPAIDVQTNKDGHWIIKDVPAGTYNITYSKEGFETYKQFGIGHVGGSISTFPYLDDFRETEHWPAAPYPYYGDRLELFATDLQGEILSMIQKDSTDADYGNYILLRGTITTKPFSKGIIVFANNKGEASPTSYNSIATGSAYDSKGNFIIRINPELLRQRGYQKGDNVSLVSYLVPVRNYSDATQMSYYDPNLGIRVYTGLSTKRFELNFKMP
jgi:hypothetical protein